MRAIHTAVRGLAPLAAAVVVMAVPALASATPRQWTEYDGTPIDTVTVDVNGNIDLEFHTYPSPLDARCQVTGEIELSNDGPGGTAIQEIVNLQPVDLTPGPAICDGWWPAGSSGPTQVTYATPWTEPIGTYGPYGSVFDDFHVTTRWGSSPGYLQLTTAGPLPMAYNAVEVGADWCIGILETIGENELDGDPNVYRTNVYSTLQFDLNTLEGLSTEEGGPCVKLADI